MALGAALELNGLNRLLGRLALEFAHRKDANEGLQEERHGDAKESKGDIGDTARLFVRHAKVEVASIRLPITDIVKEIVSHTEGVREKDVEGDPFEDTKFILEADEHVDAAEEEEVKQSREGDLKIN